MKKISILVLLILWYSQIEAKKLNASLTDTKGNSYVGTVVYPIVQFNHAVALKTPEGIKRFFYEEIATLTIFGQDSSEYRFVPLFVKPIIGASSYELVSPMIVGGAVDLYSQIVIDQSSLPPSVTQYYYVKRSDEPEGKVISGRNLSGLALSMNLGFRKRYARYFGDDKTIASKIKNKEYENGDIFQIVLDYNKSKGQEGDANDVRLDRLASGSDTGSDTESDTDDEGSSAEPVKKQSKPSAF